MGTSKSSDEAGEYVGGVSVFSGRRDPAWPVGADGARELLELWDSLEVSEGSALSAPPLGYRGSFLRGGGREWSAYRGAVTLREGAGAQTRRDLGRRFERLIISTAPPGSVPPQLLDEELRADA
jgi:hypothetical protein